MMKGFIVTVMARGICSVMSGCATTNETASLTPSERAAKMERAEHYHDDVVRNRNQANFDQKRMEDRLQEQSGVMYRNGSPVLPSNPPGATPK